MYRELRCYSRSREVAKCMLGVSCDCDTHSLDGKSGSISKSPGFPMILWWPCSSFHRIFSLIQSLPLSQHFQKEPLHLPQWFLNRRIPDCVNRFSWEEASTNRVSVLSLEEQGLAQTAGHTQYTQNKLPLSLNTTAHCFCKQSPPNLLEKRVATGLDFRAPITKFQEPNVVNHRDLLILLQL